MRFANPYDSPRVIRTLLDVVCEKIAEDISGESVPHNAFLQAYADEMCSKIVWRGIPLRKLISIECSLIPFSTKGTEVLFKLRPMSEDGIWLCKQMDLLEPPKVAFPKIPNNDKVAPEKPVTVKRIVEF